MNKELLRLIGAQVCQHSAMAGIRLIAPLLALERGYNISSIGILLSLFALSQVLLALPSGHYADQNGFRKPFLISIFSAIFGIAVAFIWPDFFSLCVAAFLTGGACGTTIIILQRYAGKFASDALALKKICGWLSIGPVIAIFIGPLLAGFIIDNFGFRIAIGAMLVPLMLSTVLVLSTKKENSRINVSQENVRESKILTFLKNREIQKLFLVDWLLACCWDIHAFLLPIFGYEKGLSATSIGTILGFFAVSAFMIRLLLPCLVNFLDEWQLIMSSMIATVLLFSIYPFMSSAFGMTLCALALGLSLGLVQPMVMSLLHQMTPADQQGQAVGVRQMIANSSSVSMPVVFGSLGAILGITPIFWIMGGIVALNFPLALRMRSRFRLLSNP